MRLLLFIYSLSLGGAERVTANLANHWAAKGWQVTVVTLAPRNRDFYELHPAVARVALDLARDSGNWLVALCNNLRRVYYLRRTLMHIKPHVAVAMMSTANVLMAISAWRLPMVRAIGAERTVPCRLRARSEWGGLRRLTYSLLTAVVALTQESATWLVSNTGAKNVVVIPNAATWPLPVLPPRLVPDSYCPAGRNVLLAVGRLEQVKGFDLLIKSFAELADRYPSWDLVILGEGPMRSALEALVQTAGVGDRVVLPGRAGNVGEWYERGDLYVMSSRFEGFPNTLAEAMAHGMPAVSFDCDTGPRDLIRHEVDGLLVSPGDVAALTAALDRLMGSADLRQRFAERAMEARNRFSMDRITGMWEELFAEVMRARA